MFSLALALLMFTVAGLGAMHLVRVSKKCTSPKHPGRELRVWTKSKNKVLEIMKDDA